jgi:signal transduction histidine kinase
VAAGECTGRLPSRRTQRLDPLDRACNGDESLNDVGPGRIALEARQVEAPQETLDRLRLEVAEVRASRRRIVLAADADRRGFEQELHQGVQQDVVALAVNLQLVSRLADVDLAAAKTLLEEMGRDVQQAIGSSGRLAARIYPPLLGSGLALALRAAASTAGITLDVDIAETEELDAASAAAALCCLEAFEHSGPGARATVVVSEEHLTFEIVDAEERSAEGLARLVDRVEALNGRLTIDTTEGAGTRVAGSLPWPR